MSDKPWLDGAVSVSDGTGTVRRSEPPMSTGQHAWAKGKEGLANSVGAIADAPGRVAQLGKAAVGTAVGAMGGSSDYMPDVKDWNEGTNALRKLLGVTGQERAADQGNKLIGAMAEGAGSSLIGANPAQSAKQLFFETLKMLGIGAAAGVGGELGAKATNDSVLGRAAGSIVGGVVAPSSGGTIGVASRLFRNSKNAATDPANMARANTLAGKVVDTQVKNAVSGTPDAAQNITEALALRDRIPGFNPSVAEMANSPGLSDMQRRFGLLNPQNLNTEVARDAANKGAVRSFYEGAAPVAETGMSGPRSAVNETLAAQEGRLTKIGQTVAGQLPKVDPLATGNALKAAADAERASAKGVTSANYQKAFDAAGDVKVDISPVIAKVEEVLGQKLSQIKPESAPNTVAKIKQLFDDSQGKTPEELAYLGSVLGGDIKSQPSNALVSLADADAIRKAVNADIASGYRSMDPIAATKLRNLQGVHGALDEAVTNSALPQNAKSLYSDALNQYRTDYVPRFKEGANLRVFKDSTMNEPRILPDKMISEYFKPDSQGGLTRASQFSSLFGRNPEAKATAEKGILDLYRHDVVNKSTGIIDVARHDAFMKEYSRTLDAFNGSGVKVADKIAQIGKQAQQAETAINRFNSLSKSLKFDSTGDMVSAALADPKVMNNVTTRMSDSARETFKRIVMDKAWEKGSAEGMQKYLSDNAQTLNMILSPKHLADLGDVAKALAIVERAPIKGTLQSGGPDIMKNATGLSTATVWSQWRATTGGRQSPVTAAFNLSMPVMNKLSQQQFSVVMERALHDPSTAAALRHFLLAGTPQQANLAGRVLSNMKLTGSIAWGAKGPVIRTIFGSEHYQNNLERAAPSMAEQAQQR